MKTYTLEQVRTMFNTAIEEAEKGIYCSIRDDVDHRDRHLATLDALPHLTRQLAILLYNEEADQ